MRTPAAIAAVLALVSTGCREEPGIPDYSDVQDAFDRADAEPEPPLTGPDPFVPGQTRLAISGIFYEGESSEFIPIDGVRTNYYIFLDGGRLTYEQEPSADRVEGASAELLTLAGTSFWGGGFVLEPGVDLTAYDVLAVSLKSSAITEVNVTVGDASLEVPVAARDFGYAADGEWHNLRIPLTEFADAGVALGAARLPFAIGAPGGALGQTILVDDLYFEAE